MKRYHSVELYDVNGRIIHQIEVSFNNSFIDMERLTRGIYIVQLSGNDLIDRIKALKE